MSSGFFRRINTGLGIARALANESDGEKTPLEDGFHSVMTEDDGVFRKLEIVQRLAAALDPTCVFICGPHKSGTSALAALVEELGFENPAHTTNPHEHGIGGAGRYWTRECAVARTINVRTRTTSTRDIEAPLKPVQGYLAIVREALGAKLVIKVPDLIQSPDVWVDAATGLGIVPIFLVCCRDRRSLERSWRLAKWTKRKLELDPSAIDNSLGLAHKTCERLGARGVHVEMIEFHSIASAADSSILGSRR